MASLFRMMCRKEMYIYQVRFVDYDGGIAVFMSLDSFNAVFEKDDDEF